MVLVQCVKTMEVNSATMTLTRISQVPCGGTTSQLDVHGSVHHNTNLIEMTNKMQLCRTIYYSIVP